LCQPVATLRNRFAMSDDLSWFVQQIITSPSSFGGKKAPRQMHGKLSCLQNGVFTRPAWVPLGRLARPYYATSWSISGLWANRQPLGQHISSASGDYAEPIEIALRRLGKHRRLRISEPPVLLLVDRIRSETWPRQFPLRVTRVG
jgi:hypothetical protein